MNGGSKKMSIWWFASESTRVDETIESALTGFGFVQARTAFDFPAFPFLDPWTRIVYPVPGWRPTMRPWLILKETVFLECEN
jgi:hypothetical protein